MVITPHENLANAIIVQAVKDYRDAKKKQGRKRTDLETNRTIIEVESFLLSDWFYCLTSVDGNVILKKLKSEARR